MKKRFWYIAVSILFFLQCATADVFEEENLNYTKKMLRDVKTMENRHFGKKFEDVDFDVRLARLEIELMGREFSDLPLDIRMDKVKLASQKRMLSGTSIPPQLRKYYSVKQMNNNNVEIVNNNDVGLIDGFLRLFAPDFFDYYRASRDRYFERYVD